MVLMRFGDSRGHIPAPARASGRKGARRGRRLGVAAVSGALWLAGCSRSAASLPPTTVATTSTTSTTVPVVSNLMIDGVRPGVLQAPFYPQATVTQVTCGTAPKGGRFVRIDLPAGAAGTTARSVLTKPTAVIVVTGAAVVVDPRFVNRVLYAEAMKSITVSTQGSFVLTMSNLQKVGGDGLSVQVGNVRVIGGYQCPATDVAYPGT